MCEPARTRSPSAAALWPAVISACLIAAPSPVSADEELVDEPAVVVEAAGFEAVEIDLSANINAWLFNGRTAEDARDRLESLLQLKIDEIVRLCGVTEVQRHKLQLAGRGDLQRFFERIEQLREKYEGVKDQNKLGEAWQEVQVLQASGSEGPFDHNSIFAKTLRTLLSDAQRQTYQQAQHQRRTFRYAASVAGIVQTLDRSLALRDEQRRKFTQLILDETRAPERFGQYDLYVVLYQLARLPEPKLRPLFDDRQWRQLHRQFQQFQGIEQFLTQQGLLPATSPAEVPAAADPPE